VTYIPGPFGQYLEGSLDLILNLLDRQPSQIRVRHGVRTDFMPFFQQRFYVVPRQELCRRDTESLGTKFLDLPMVGFADDRWGQKETCRRPKLAHYPSSAQTVLQAVIETNGDVRPVDVSAQNPIHGFGVAHQTMPEAQSSKKVTKRILLVSEHVVHVQKLDPILR
jgi:hypothetical protein